MKKNIFILLGLLSILILWLIVSLSIDNSLVLPTINQVLESLKDILSDSRTYLIIFMALLKLILTCILSLVIALVLATLSFMSIKFADFLKPFLVIFKTIPIISIIILLLIFFGNNKSPYIMTMLVVLPIMYESLMTGFKSINPEILYDVKTISNLNFSVLKSIYLPLIFQHLVLGIMQSFGLGLKVMIMGEFITQPKSTIGYILQLERINLNTSNILAWTIILIVIVLLVELLINKVSKKFKY